MLYRWRCRPMRQNMSGAGQRPTPQYVWGEIQSRLPAGIPDPELDESPEFARPDQSWSVFLTFLTMMLAHGWFLRPKAFPLARPGDRPSADARRMKRRVAAFAAAWVAALALLPITCGWRSRPSGLGGYRVARRGGLVSPVPAHTARRTGDRRPVGAALVLGLVPARPANGGGFGKGRALRCDSSSPTTLSRSRADRSTRTDGSPRQGSHLSRAAARGTPVSRP